MQNRFTKAFAACGMLLALASCKKDETQAVLQTNAAPQLTASATTASLVKANASTTAVTYTWAPADFGYKAAVTYTLQFAKQGTNFATPQQVAMGTALTKTFTIDELNGVYGGLDCNIAGNATRLDVRVKATVADNVAPMYSNLASIFATPYQSQTPPADSWAIIGSATANGWGAETPMTYDFCNQVWKITLPLTATAGSNEFKFRANNAWTLNYGDDGADGKLEANGANIAVPATGNYEVVLNVNATPKPTYTLTRRP